MHAPRRFSISELSKHSGVPTATIKFYLREGLLEQGELSAPQRAYYSERHVQRLMVIRALRNVAGLSVATVRELIHTLSRGQHSPVDVVSTAIDALASGNTEKPGRAEQKARQHVEKYLRARGVAVRSGSSALTQLAAALVAIRDFEPDLDVETALEPYFQLALGLARHEVGVSTTRILEGPESALIRAVVGTVLWEPVILQLRRIASEHLARELYRSERTPR